MTYEAALAALHERADLAQIAAAMEVEHARFERQALCLEQLAQERRQCACTVDDPLDLPSESLSAADALATLEQIGAWFYRRQAPEFARSVTACREALAAERERAEQWAQHLRNCEHGLRSDDATRLRDAVAKLLDGVSVPA